MQEEKPHEIDIELDDQIATGQYANLVIISHSSSEFVLDFASVMPGVPKARIRNRIVMAPEHAKRLLLSLQENITRLEVDLYKFKRYFEYKRVIPQNWEYYSEKIDIIYNQIDRLREAIKEIKINRLNIQKCLEK